MNYSLMIFITTILLSSLIIYCIPLRFRKGVLLCVSLSFFYQNGLVSLLMVIGMIVVSFLFSIYIQRHSNKWVLGIEISILVFVLFLIKYVSPWTGMGLFVPLGLSYYCLMMIGYLIEVHRGRETAEKNLITYAAFITFFPQIIAGPIGRSKSLLAQWSKSISFQREEYIQGFIMLLWGVMQKLVLADTLAIVTEQIFSANNPQHGWVILLGIAAYAFQIYMDFSGYSYIAIGGARMLGIHLMDNFQAPFMATSIREFWRRWHISLSSWFRDYLYFPLGGSRAGKYRTDMNCMIVFVVSGLWHGAAIGYLLWGTLHGIFQVVSRHTQSIRERMKIKLHANGAIYRWMQRVSVFVLVAFAFLPFRMMGLAEVWRVIRQLFTWNSIVFTRETMESVFGISYISMIACGILLLLVLVIQAIWQKNEWFVMVQQSPFLIRLMMYIVLCVIVLIWGIYGIDYQATNFIYGNF